MTLESQLSVGTDAFRSFCDRLRRSCESREVVALLGAGISAEWPSCVPTAPALTAPLVEALSNAACDTATPQQVQAAVRKLAQRMPLERLLDVLGRFQRSEVSQYLSVLDSTTFNDSHLALAALAAEGLLDRCITLNFDTLIERACDSLGVPWRVEIPLLPHRPQMGSTRPQLTILKPHGSFAAPEIKEARDTDLLPTLGEIGEGPHALNRAAIRRAMQGRPVLLVAGYGRCDWDVWPIVEELADELRELVWLKFRATDAGPEPRICRQTTVQVVTVPAVDVLRAVAGRPKGRPNGRCAAPRVSASLFEGSNGSPRLRWALSELVPARDESLRRPLLLPVLRWASRTGDSELRAATLASLSWTRHMCGHIDSAITLQRGAIMSSTMRAARPQETRAAEHRSLAYLYIGKLKRLRYGADLMSAPFFALAALKNQMAAMRATPRRKRALRRSDALLHWASAVHVWALASVIIPRFPGALRRVVLRAVAAGYRRALSHAPLYMERQYYELRALEAEIIGGRESEARSRCGAWLAEIADYEKCLTRAGSGHLGCVHVCRALVAWRSGIACSDGLCRQSPCVACDLSRAEAHWERLPAGRVRVALLRACLGLSSPQEARRAWRDRAALHDGGNGR